MTSSAPTSFDNDDAAIDPGTIERLRRRVHLVRIDHSLALYLAWVDAIACIERFMVHRGQLVLVLLFSGVAGGAVLGWLVYLALMSIGPIAPYPFAEDGSRSRARWAMNTFSVMAKLWAQLVAAMCLGVGIQFLPTLWIDPHWIPEPTAFAQVVGLRLSATGEAAFESSKDLLWISWFCGWVAAILGRLRACRIPVFGERAAVTLRDLNWLVGIVLFMGLPVVAWQMFVVLPASNDALYSVHVCAQALGLVTCLAGYVALYRWRWKTLIGRPETPRDLRPRARFAR